MPAFDFSLTDVGHKASGDQSGVAYIGPLTDEGLIDMSPGTEGKHKVLIVGDNGQNSCNHCVVVTFNPRDQSLSHVALPSCPVPSDICYVTLTRVGGSAYLFGGYSSSHTSGTDALYRFDIASMTWTHVHKRGDWPSARHAHVAFTLSGRLYITGGDSSKRDTWYYTPETGVWVKVGDAPCKAYCSCSCVVDGRAYVFGGWSSSEMISFTVQDGWRTSDGLLLTLSGMLAYTIVTDSTDDEDGLFNLYTLVLDDYASLVETLAIDVIRDVAGEYTGQEWMGNCDDNPGTCGIITIGNAIEARLGTALLPFHIKVESFPAPAMDLPTTYEDKLSELSATRQQYDIAVQEQLTAETEYETQKRNAIIDTGATIAMAQGEAYASVSEATGMANATRIVADAHGIAAARYQNVLGEATAQSTNDNMLRAVYIDMLGAQTMADLIVDAGTGSVIADAR
ncbi:hypothetical protein KIPB_006017 [Kipferlia bialata]|uniref:Band 7 domain-containing protein n=1 Tax=Kipferlia bialata TaxID=797122 RepID=A0A9K3CZG7_9EUKA|nr:hypothetical protein KIPB_006017 [Kipferlia bialata]|eukprot:g6017.t1